MGHDAPASAVNVTTSFRNLFVLRWLGATGVSQKISTFSNLYCNSRVYGELAIELIVSGVVCQVIPCPHSFIFM